MIKGIIGFLSGLFIFCIIFYLDARFIHWIVEPLHGDTKVVVWIAIWILTIGFALWIACILGIVVGTIIYSLLTRNDE